MDTELKTLWVDALLSGKYKKGRKTLRKTTLDGVDRFCAMGVFCDIVAPDCWDPKDKMGLTSHLGHIVLPAREFLNRALLTGEQARSVLKLNDEDGWSFTAIAQWIRENLS